MSAPKYRIPAKFRSLLHDRGMTVQLLAIQSGIGLGATQRTLASHPKTGREQRWQLMPLLTADEKKALRWSSAGELLPVEQSAPRPVPRLKPLSPAPPAMSATAPT